MKKKKTIGSGRVVSGRFGSDIWRPDENPNIVFGLFLRFFFYPHTLEIVDFFF